MLLWLAVGFLGGLLVFSAVAVWWLSRFEFWR